MICAICGHRNPSGNFCASCGGRLADARSDETTASIIPVPAEPDDEGPLEGDEPIEGVAALVVRRGPNAGERFALTTDIVTAGRHPESDIFLDDITVSRRHAELTRTGSVYRLRDTGSLNGTYLNRARIDEAVLKAGDEVQIGKYRLVFVAASEDA